MYNFGGEHLGKFFTNPSNTNFKMRAIILYEVYIFFVNILMITATIIP